MGLMRKQDGTAWKWLGMFAVAYLSCAIHDDWRMRRGEHDMCILPTLEGVLWKALGL
jgi:hypothetical protein